jgi:hypothetical protein
MLPLNLPELEVSGLALVTAIDDCPPIADGKGSVVTARFVTREVHVVASVDVLGADGTVETITGTTIHPVWSVDRQEWVPLAELAEGERLQGLDGLAVVLGVSLSRVSQPVYNIEAHGEHVYQVGELGVVVRNACPLPVQGRPAHGGVAHNSTLVSTALSWMRGGMTNVRTNQALSDGINTLSNLRPDVQGISNGLIHIAEVNFSGGPGYHAARELLFRQILGPRFGSYLPL